MMRLGIMLLLPLFVLVFGANIAEKSPYNWIRDCFLSLSGNKKDVSKSPADYEVEIGHLNSKLDTIQFLLDDCLKKNDFRKARVIIDSETVNVRSEASLTSDIEFQIPNGSEVEVLFFDTEKYYLDGRQGKWCKIKYAGSEGWVWGNFLDVQD